MPALPHWFWPGDDRPTDQIDDEIAEELRLHLDLLAEEHQRRGLAPEEAQQKAAERFGDFDDLLRRCRREKQGDAVMLRRAQAVLTGLLVAAIVAMGWQQWRVGNRFDDWQMVLKGYDDRLSEINDRLKIMGPGRDDSADDVVTIRVVDEKGKSVPDSLLTFSWKNGADTYDQFTIKTDEKGVCTTPVMFRGMPLETVTVSAPGHVPIGESLNRPFAANETLTLQLKPEIKQRFMLLVIRNDDSMGKDADEAQELVLNGEPRKAPLSNVQVITTSRDTPVGKVSQRPWGQSTNLTDQLGVVEIGMVAKGDTVYLTAWQENNTWTSGPVKITGDSEPIRVEMRSQNGRGGFGGGFGGGGGGVF